MFTVIMSEKKMSGDKMSETQIFGLMISKKK